MERIRIFLYIALFAVVFLLWQTWQQEHQPQVTTVTTTTAANSSDVPPLAAQQQASSGTPPVAATTAPTANPEQPTAQLISVDTDVLHAEIDPKGGNLVNLQLLKYPVSSKNPDQPTALLNTAPDTLYLAQSGLIGKQGPDTQEGQAVFTPEQLQYRLAPDQNSMDVKMSWKDKNGVTINKIYTFKKGKYDIQSRYEIDNQSTQPWTGQFYAQMRHKPQPSGGIFSFHTYQGAAISSAADPYQKFSYDKLKKENLDRSIDGGWLALQQRYFLTSWIPPQNQSNHYYSRMDDNQVYTVGVVGPTMNVAPGQTTTTSATFYGGPEIADNLKPLAPHLELTIDYGWLWPISVAIFWVMKHIYNIVGNWGWSIVLVTLLIKLLFYKLSETSYRSMAKMRKLTPKLQAIKERYGDDRQKLSQATMELYRKEKANPMSGCLPMIVQIPFFIALYYVLIESVELRQAPWILWIQDLSSRDPYYVLPILMGLSMWVQQKLNPPPTDPMQARMFMLLPVMMTLFFLAFPAGLVLYWLVNNCAGILQQWYITKRMETQDKKPVKA